MDKAKLADSVGAEFGDEIAAEVKKQLKTGISRDLNMTEIMAAAAFIVQCAQLALQFWGPGTDRDRRALVDHLEAEAPTFKKLDPEKRRNILLRIADELTPSK